MASTPVKITDVGELALFEDPDLFFHRLGECKLANGDSRSDCSVSVSRDTGHAYIAVGSRLYVAKTRDLESWLSKIDDSDSVPSLPTLFEEQGPALEVSWVAPGTITSLSLTQDGSLLAAAAGGRVHAFRATDLASVWESSGGEQDATTVGFSGRSLAILGATGRLSVVDLVGSSADATSQRASEVCRAGVSSFSFSPPSLSKLAFAVDDEVRIYDLASGSVERSIKLTCNDALLDDNLRMRVDGLVWIKDRAIVASAEISPDEDRLVTMLCLTWTSDHDVGGDGDGFELQELYKTDVSPACPPDQSNQMLVGASIRAWDGTAILAHKGIFDGHIRPFISSAGAAGTTSLAFENITEDKLCIRIPNGPRDADNCVMNICLDFTMGPACPHPLDNQADDLRGFPRAWILTSDGLLRAYIMGSVAGRPAVCFEACPIPPVDDLVVTGGGGGGGRIREVASDDTGDATSGDRGDDGGNALLMAGMSAALDDDSDLGEPASDDDDAGRETQEARTQDAPKTLLTSAPVATKVSPVPYLTAVLDPKPAERKTPDVPFPQAALKQAGGDFPRIEAEFLDALHATRVLERETYGVMSSSMKDLTSLRGATNALLERARRAVDELADVRERFTDVAASMNESCGRVDAMPLFQRVESAGRGAMDAKRRGLDALLASAKESAKEQVKQLSFAAEELCETMSILQDEHRHSTHDHPIRALEESVAAQSAIICNQTSRVNALWETVKPSQSFSARPSFRPSPTQLTLLHVSPKHDRPKWVTLAGHDPATNMDVNNSFLFRSGIDDDALLVSDELAADILERAIGGGKGGVRLTVVQRAKPGPRRLSAALQPLKPIEFAEIPEPVAFVEQELKVVVPMKAAAGEKPVVAAAVRPLVADSSSVQPPVPSFGMLAKSKTMMAAAVEQATVPVPKPQVSGSSSIQPPVPSFGMLQQSKAMMAAAVPVGKPAAVAAVAAERPAAVGSSSGMMASPAVGSSNASFGGGFGAGFGGMSGFGQASAFGQTAFGQPAGFSRPTTVFGAGMSTSTTGVTQSSPFASSSSPFGAVATQAPSSSPFGAVATQAPSSSPFGAVATQAPSSSPFGGQAPLSSTPGGGKMWTPRK